MITFALWHSVQAERIRGGLAKLGLVAIIPYAIGFIPTHKKIACQAVQCTNDLSMHH